MGLFDSMFGGGDASKQTKAYQAQQAQMAANQMQMYNDVAPQYMKAIDFLSQYAGQGAFHPSDFGSYGSAGAAPPPGSSPGAPLGQPDLTQRQGYVPPLGALYNPSGQSTGGWNWDAPGTQTMAKSAAGAAQTKPDIFGNASQRGAMTGQGDPLTQPPGMGPNPYPAPGQTAQAQQPSQPPVPGAQSPAKPISRQQQYIQSNPQLGTYNPNNSSSQNRQQIQQQTAAGVGAPGSPYTNGAPLTGGVNNQQMGIYNSPMYALQNAQAQDAINQQNRLSQQNLKAQLGSRGLEDSSMLGAGLTQMNNAANNQYANFRQNLAINAPAQQAAANEQLLAAINPGFNSGQQSAGNYSNLTQSSFQQQQQQQQALQNLFQGLGMLSGYGLFGGGGGGGNASGLTPAQNAYYGN